MQNDFDWRVDAIRDVVYKAADAEHVDYVYDLMSSDEVWGALTKLVHQWYIEDYEEGADDAWEECRDADC